LRRACSRSTRSENCGVQAAARASDGCRSLCGEKPAARASSAMAARAAARAGSETGVSMSGAVSLGQGSGWIGVLIAGVRGLAYRAASRRSRGSAAWRRGTVVEIESRDAMRGCNISIQYLERGWPLASARAPVRHVSIRGTSLRPSSWRWHALPCPAMPMLCGMRRCRNIHGRVTATIVCASVCTPKAAMG
jgi:hypothetical protein